VVMRVINIFPALLLTVALITSGLRPAEAPIYIAPAGTDVREYRYIEFLMMPKEEPEIRIMEATAYCYGAKTSTGTVPTPGRTVAVDPTVFPYGTELSINGVPGYIAEDCGGDIKGDRLDIFVEDYSTAITFGRRQVEVRVLKVP
jgi:3D (Asp-Asp-Asp) domain-containing protein